MNSLIQRNKTYGELLTELRARLGFVAQGPSANNNKHLLASFLEEGHDFVYSQLEPTTMRKKTVITLEPGSYLYDWHNDIEDEDISPGLVNSVWVVDGKTRYPMVQGISEALRKDDSRSRPTHYDTLEGQIELWPVPDSSRYGLLIDYIADKPRFTAPSDRPGVPHRLVFLYALSLGKSHFRHPDAQAATSAFNAEMKQAKSSLHENRRFFVKRKGIREGEVVGLDGNYQYVSR